MKHINDINRNHISKCNNSVQSNCSNQAQVTNGHLGGLSDRQTAFDDQLFDKETKPAKWLHQSLNCVMLGYVPEKPTATNHDMHHVRFILKRKNCQHTAANVTRCRPFNNLLIADRDYQSESSLHGTSVSKATGSCILSKLLLTCNLNNIFLSVIQRLSRTFNAYVNTNTWSKGFPWKMLPCHQSNVPHFTQHESSLTRP